MLRLIELAQIRGLRQPAAEDAGRAFLGAGQASGRDQRGEIGRTADQRVERFRRRWIVAVILAPRPGRHRRGLDRALRQGQHVFRSGADRAGYRRSNITQRSRWQGRTQVRLNERIVIDFLILRHYCTRRSYFLVRSLKR